MDLTLPQGTPAEMTTVLTLQFEGPPACQDCQRIGVPVCNHNGFNAEAWDHLVGQGVTVPGLDPHYQHVLRAVDISEDRNTISLTVDTDRPRFHDLARHLSTHTDVRAKAAVRAVHHHTDDTLEDGYYDRFLTAGDQVCIDRDLYRVHSVDHPNRNDNGIAEGVDVQVARLVPVPVDPIGPAG